VSGDTALNQRLLHLVRRVSGGSFAVIKSAISKKGFQMKKYLLGLTAFAVLAGGGLQARADKVPLAQVPEAVEKAIKEQSKGEAIQDVERETKDGKVTLSS
jgi:hypothetical protein